MKKILILLFLSAFLSDNLALYAKKKAKEEEYVLDLTESVQSAESIEDEAEYKAIAPMDKEPELQVFKIRVSPPQPHVKPPRDKKIDEKKTEEEKKKEKEEEEEEKKEIDDIKKGNLSDKTREKLAATAIKWYKQNVKTADINGRKVTIYNDCSNFIRAVYWSVIKRDLFYDAQATGGVNRNNTDLTSGVRILHSYCNKKLRFSKAKAKVGDMIFFSNTYDRNRNKKTDDPNVHIAIVTSLGSDGTVYFIHANAGGQIKEGKLNLKEPSNNKKNIYLKRKYSWEKVKRVMSGELTSGFGGF
ncbi:MAG TPA: hypothetical protein DHW82_02725 [Spirochaetia bacterium]|nr:MAG: hypothetical protein A2Y41_10595 [Spirochaetes bacterium GWB1_36_13]HCL55906.1 hypothetical protein [Spirochaetia bacterium]